MASEALAVVQRWLEAEDTERMLDCLDPDVVWFGTRGGLDQDQVLRGPEAVLEYVREIREPWERFDFEVERFMTAGDTVVVFMRETGRPHQSSVDIQNDTAMVFTVRDEKIVEMTGYLDRDEAVRAAGLEGAGG
jgi:ketosteroid isomerase-like protein